MQQFRLAQPSRVMRRRRSKAAVRGREASKATKGSKRPTIASASSSSSGVVASSGSGSEARGPPQPTPTAARKTTGRSRADQAA